MYKMYFEAFCLAAARQLLAFISLYKSEDTQFYGGFQSLI